MTKEEILNEIEKHDLSSKKEIYTELYYHLMDHSEDFDRIFSIQDFAVYYFKNLKGLGFRLNELSRGLPYIEYDNNTGETVRTIQLTYDLWLDILELLDIPTVSSIRGVKYTPEGIRYDFKVSGRTVSVNDSNSCHKKLHNVLIAHWRKYRINKI